MMVFSQAAAYFGSLTVSCGFLWRVFQLVDDHLSDQGRASIATWVKGADPLHRVEGLPQAIIGAFDSVFGTRRLSLRFYIRAVVISTIATLAAFVSLGLLRIGLGNFVRNWWGAPIQTVIGWTLGVCLLADYVSLLVALRMLAIDNKPIRCLGIVLILLIITGFVIVAPFVLFE